MSSESEEDVTATVNSCLRRKRALLRSIDKAKNTVLQALSENPSHDLVQKVNAFLDSWRLDLGKLSRVDDQLLDRIDTSVHKTPVEVDAAEKAITKSHETSVDEYNSAKAELNAIVARLHKQERFESTTSRQSMNSTFLPDSTLANPLAKLPDIKVPKFDGKIRNFTEWHAIFNAMIHTNEQLKPIHKLYFLKKSFS